MSRPSNRPWRVRAAVTAVAVAGLTLSPATANAANATATVNSNGVPLTVRAGPTSAHAATGSLAHGSSVGLDCWASGTAIAGPNGTTSIWYRTANGGYVTDAFLLTGSNDPVTPACAAGGDRNVGNVRDGNYYPYGQCTWGAYQKFYEATGLFPEIVGNAADWHESAVANGWSVVLDAQARSVVVFQPGVQGADPTYGHVAWVDSVEDTADGRVIYITEMNANGAGDGTWSTRAVLDVPGMSFILAP